jgi:hypothetical protein
VGYLHVFTGFFVSIGVGIYVKVGNGPNFGKYSVNLNGVTVQQDAFDSAGNGCNVSFVQTNLPNGMNSITIDSLGPSSQAASNSPGNFELVNFM